MKCRMLLISVTILISILLVFGAVSMAETAKIEPVKLGIVVPRSGPLSFGGSEVLNALTLAVEHKATLFGRPIELVVGDGPDPTSAVAEFQRLVSNKGITVMFGGYGSAIESSLERAAEENGILYLGLVNWSEAITDHPHKFYFRLNPHMGMFAISLADRAIKLGTDVLKKSPNELRIGCANSDDTAYVMDPIIENLNKKGIKPVLHMEYPGNIKDFSSIITKMRGEKLDILILAQYSAEGLLFRKQMKALQYEPPITFGAGLVFDQPEFAQLGDAANGVLCLSYTSTAMNPKIALGLSDFHQEYIKRFGHPPLTHALQAFSGGLFYLNVIEQVGELNLEKIMKALLAADVPPGILPSTLGVKFDPIYHQNIRAANHFVLGQWQDGRYCVVWPENYATTELKISWTE